MIGGGLWDGSIDHLKKHPLETATGAIGSASLGAELTFMQRGASPWRLAAEIAGVAFTVGAAKSLISGTNWSGISHALSDTWKSDRHYLENRQIIARELGPIALDTTVMGLSGLAGAYGARRWQRLSTLTDATLRGDTHSSASANAANTKVLEPYSTRPPEPLAGKLLEPSIVGLEIQALLTTP